MNDTAPHEPPVSRRTMITGATGLGILGVAGIELASAGPAAADGGGGGHRPEARPAIIPPEGGERLTRRWGYPLTIAVDPVTTGSKTLTVGTETLALGLGIPQHRHHMDEVIIVLAGTVHATVGDEEADGGPGTIIYAPPHAWIQVDSLGPDDAVVVWIFPEPGFEEYVRDTSVPRGETPTPMTPEEMEAVREKYKDVIEFPEGSDPYP